MNVGMASNIDQYFFDMEIAIFGKYLHDITYIKLYTQNISRIGFER